MSDNRYFSLDELSEPVIVTDGDYQCLHANPAFCAYFRRPLDQWIGRAFNPKKLESKWVSHSVGVDVDAMARFVTRLGDGEKDLSVEWQQSSTRDGGFIFTGRDVTERLQEEQTLRETAATAQAASETKMRFLATMSHEMRTPLNGILGMTGLLIDSGLDANQKAYADAVRESGTALLALINDILDYSKIDAGRVDLEETAFDPQSLVQSVAELLSPRAAHKGLEIASYVDPTVPKRLIGDEARLRQVLLNLAGNGVKFTEEGGVIIEVFGEGTAAPGKQLIRVNVRDTGVGISPDAQARIFDEFAQADSSHSRKFEGTGLGLAIARRIVQAMDGDIKVESTIGEGSSFSFVVSLQVPAGRRNNRAEDRRVQDRIVVVTQSKLLNEALGLQLSASGVDQFEIFADPDEAEAFMRRHSNCVLLCDLNLAAQYGQRLSKLAAHSLVLLSPVARGRLEAFRRAGFHGYLIKPIRQSSLMERLHDRSVAPRKIQRLDALATAPKPGPRRLRVLLAEDNQINAVLATAIIKRAGHHVDVAANGVEAVDAIKAAPYDLVLMDMHMPEMDGLEATRQIRQLQGDLANKPIIALTANAMKTDRETCLEAGMDDFLTKPFDPVDLVGLIDKWADGRSAEPAPEAEATA